MRLAYRLPTRIIAGLALKQDRPGRGPEQETVWLAGNPATPTLSGNIANCPCRGLKEGTLLRKIASRRGHATSTISRGVRANGGRATYRSSRADERAVRSATRPRNPQLAHDVRLEKEAERLLSDRWSPQQISAHLRQAYPDDEGMRIRHVGVLAGALHASPRQTSQGAHCMPEARPRQPQVARTQRDVGPDARHDHDQRTACGGRRPRGPRPLGVRLGDRQAWRVGYWNAGRAEDALSRSAASERPRRRRRTRTHELAR